MATRVELVSIMVPLWGSRVMFAWSLPQLLRVNDYFLLSTHMHQKYAIEPLVTT